MAITQPTVIGLFAHERLRLASNMASAAAAQASTNSEVVLSGSEVDLRMIDLISALLKNSGANAVNIYFYVANLESFADEVLYRTETGVAAAASVIFCGAASGSAAALLSWNYLRIKIKSTVADTAGAVWGTIAGK